MAIMPLPPPHLLGMFGLVRTCYGSLGLGPNGLKCHYYYYYTLLLSIGRGDGRMAPIATPFGWFRTCSDSFDLGPNGLKCYYYYYYHTVLLSTGRGDGRNSRLPHLLGVFGLVRTRSDSARTGCNATTTRQFCSMR